jgi:hypothetical protein
MKLNLVPTSASRGAGARNGIILAVILVAAAVFMSAGLRQKSAQALSAAKDDVTKNVDTAAKAKTTGDEADTIIVRAQGPLLNLQLANAMDQHNDVYPKFYDSVIKYIPNYFRINSLRATPLDGNSCTVTMTGVVASFQQYANLMLALLRIPGAQAVSRSGYQVNDMFVPNLIKDDQVGRAIMPGKPRLPENPVDRLDLLISSAGSTTFAGVGGFGSLDEPRVRGASPTESNIAVAVVLTQNLLTPNPRATLSGAAAAFAASTAASAATTSATPPAGKG